MKPHQRAFIEFALQHEVLRFGEFTLKSGRSSPYFFNAGGFDSGEKLAGLAGFYAAAITDAATDFDVLFGPAYKGIPIAAATAVQLAERHGRSVPWCFNRKEAKGHGEGGTIVGAPLTGRALIVDDVITAGTAIRETMALLAAVGATAAGVLVAVDRQERGTGALSAIGEVEAEFGIVVHSIVTFGQIVEYLEETGRFAEHLTAVRTYRDTYGVA